MSRVMFKHLPALAGAGPQQPDFFFFLISINVHTEP
jgi:hypothetical protein